MGFLDKAKAAANDLAAKADTALANSGMGGPGGATGGQPDKLFRDLGVIRVDDLQSLLDASVALAWQPAPAGPRIGVTTLTISAWRSACSRVRRSRRRRPSSTSR